MPFIRSLLALVLLSLLCSAALTALGGVVMPAGQRGGYAVLLYGGEFSDREIRERLAARGLGKAVISESSQWVFLDDFGTLERIPLDEYFGRVTPFDPRNDGYADRLRSFFMRDGKRLLFIPREAAGPPGLEKRIAAALPDVPHSVEYLGYGKPVALFFLIFILALAGLFVLRLTRPGWIPPAGYLVPCLPPLASLALSGVWGFALGAVLLGLSVLLYDPCFEFFATRRYRRTGPPASNPRRKKRLWREAAHGPFMLRRLIVLLFPVCYAMIVLCTGFHPLLAAAVFAVYGGLFVCSLWRLSLCGVSCNHIRFTPVLIVRPRLNVSFLFVMLPFALGTAPAGLVSALASGPPVPASAAAIGDTVITEAEYYAHAVFQSDFSRRPLGRADTPPGRTPYPEYVMGDDGLLSPDPSPPFADGDVRGILQEIPPFPLKSLTRFLENAGSGKTGPGKGFR
ncbi:MAG: hypothetical protein LBD48_01235 [Treponema sp.]|jgi:hypothetical protein|nr:hypothetical protein [Treponema sp.]